MVGSYRIRMVRYCSKDGCNKRSVAEVISKEPFDGCRETKDSQGVTDYTIDLCPDHLNEI